MKTFTPKELRNHTSKLCGFPVNPEPVICPNCGRLLSECHGNCIFTDAVATPHELLRSGTDCPIEYKPWERMLEKMSDKLLSGGRDEITSNPTGDVRWQPESMSQDHCNPYRSETQAEPAQSVPKDHNDSTTPPYPTKEEQMAYWINKAGKCVGCNTPIAREDQLCDPCLAFLVSATEAND